MGAVTIDFLPKSEITGAIADLTDSILQEAGDAIALINNTPDSALQSWVTNGQNAISFQDQSGTSPNFFRYQVGSGNNARIEFNVTGVGARFDLKLNGNLDVYNPDGVTIGTRLSQIQDSYLALTVNLGIGTSSPTAKLDVNGTSKLPTLTGATVSDNTITATDVFATG